MVQEISSTDGNLHLDHLWTSVMTTGNENIIIPISMTSVVENQSINLGYKILG